MYRDLKNLDFIEGDDSYVNYYLQKNKTDNDEVVIAGFGRHPNSKQFDDSFYLQNNIPFILRWENFHVDRDIDSEIKLFNHFGVKENEYIFIHDDHSRGFFIDEDKIIDKSLPIIRPVKGLTDNVFDYCYLMANSFESHFIDSSFRLIFDSLKLRNTNIFYHINLMGGVQKDGTFSQSFLDFKHI
jgi:hypothetical protein